MNLTATDYARLLSEEYEGRTLFAPVRFVKGAPFHSLSRHIRGIGFVDDALVARALVTATAPAWWWRVLDLFDLAPNEHAARVHLWRLKRRALRRHPDRLAREGAAAAVFRV